MSTITRQISLCAKVMVTADRGPDVVGAVIVLDDSPRYVNLSKETQIEVDKG